MKHKGSKGVEAFTASNGIRIVFAPDADAQEALPSDMLDTAKVMSPKEAGIDPELLEAWSDLRETRGRGRPKSHNPKRPISFRFDGAIVEHLKHSADGYNGRVEALIRQAIDEGRI